MKDEQQDVKKRFVSGLGGFFFRAKDPGLLGEWYEKYFDISSTLSNQLWHQEAGPTVFAPFKEDTAYFGRREQMFMLNFRVTNLDRFIDYLKASGVLVDEKRQHEDYGRFAWVYDPEGNKIELWEPPQDNISLQ
jgi:catechol 2,3-dioxygenase-like lactoylglutathione lyase family enzyme